MAEESFPYEELAAGDRTVSAAMFAKHLGMQRSTGVVAGLDDALAVTASSPAAQTIDVASGAAFVGLTELRAYRNTLPRTLTVPIADFTNPRHDLVVLQLTTSTDPDTRRVTALVVQGTPAATPVDPVLIQQETLSHLPLARIVVGAGVSSITNADIVDLRPYSQPITGPGFDVPLAGLLQNIRDSQALLCFSDFSSVVLHNQPFDLGMSAFMVSSGAVLGAATGAGGAVAIKTGTSTNSSVAIGGIGRQSITPSRDPQFAALLKSSPGGSGLLAQGWGLISTISPTNWTNVIWRKAMFRSVTTGALFAVTGDGVTEQTTDLSSLHTLGTDALFEIQSRSGGLLWDFLIDGVIVASHSTIVPANAMYSVAGIQNNTTTDYRIDNLDLLYTYQQRS